MGSRTMLLMCNHWYMYNNTVKGSAKNKKAISGGLYRKVTVEVLPYMGYRGMCHRIGSGSWGS